MRILGIIGVLALVALFVRGPEGAGATGDSGKQEGLEGHPAEAAHAEPAALLSGITSRVSVASDGIQGDESSRYSSISADGRYVAFQSTASNLVSGDGNGESDVFVHDRQTGQTSRVSVASDGTQANGHSNEPSISADGRYVAFYSWADNLVPEDNNRANDVFVHDRQTGETTRVSVDSRGTEGNSSSHYSSISTDGRFVAFDSWADNLAPGDGAGVFVHDRQTGETSRVSAAPDGEQGNWLSSFPSISANGRYVAFESRLVFEDSYGRSDVFVYDRQTGQTSRLSIASDGTQGNGDSNRPSISADGRYVAFISLADNLVPGDSYSYADVFLHDRDTGLTSRVSVASDGTQGDFYSGSPSISGDGRYVVFASLSGNLVGGDTNGWDDVFVHDRQAGLTSRVSVASDGTQGNSTSTWPAISADARYVVFTSWASNLVAGDTNGYGDVFVHERGESPGSSGGFLEFPVDYTDFIQVTGLQDLEGGRIRTRVDHDRAQGAFVPYTGGAPHPAYSAADCPRASCYNNADAIDIGGNRGATVRAAASGTVVDVYADCGEGYPGSTCASGWGNYVLIDHDNCYRTRYSHLQGLASEFVDGEGVTSGQPIGTLGSSGNSGGPHLDFQVRRDPNCDGAWDGQGDIVDPYGWDPITPGQPDPLTTNTGYLWLHPHDQQSEIGTAGGTALGPDGRFQVDFSEGVMSASATIDVRAIDMPAMPASGWWAVLGSYWFRVVDWLGGASGELPMATSVEQSNEAEQFSEPVSVQFNYSDEGLKHLDEFSVQIHQWDDTTQAWLAIPTSRNTLSNVTTAQTLEPGIFSLQGPILCGDVTEPNDEWSAATSAQLNTSVQGSFDVAGDEDWYVFEVPAGGGVTMLTMESAGAASPMLEVYRNGDILVASGQGAVRVSAPADRGETLYLRVVSSAAASGCDVTYGLLLAGNELYLPAIMMR